MEESKRENNIVLTKPFFSSDEDSSSNYRPPNLIKRILSLFQNVVIGSDFTSMQLPAHFNIPKSLLQFYGESVYSIRSELLSKCNNGENSMERFIAVIAWNISTTQAVKFGTIPYNPILGETHHVSKATLNVLLEQISHHPPVSAFHATDEKANLEIVSCQNPNAKFYGTSAEAEFRGKKQLNLHNYGESYVTFNTPKLVSKFLPMPGMEWIGKQRIQCRETGLEAELSYGRTSYLGLRGNPRSIKGNIFHSSSLKPLFKIDGTWDETVTLTDLGSCQRRVIYNAKEAISGLKTPIVMDPKAICASESVVVWNEVSQELLKKNWAKATEMKKSIEEKQRKLSREKQSRGEKWVSKHFNISYSKEVGWDCSPIQKLVPPAPITVLDSP